MSETKLAKYIRDTLIEESIKSTNKTLAPKNGNQRKYICSVENCERPAYAKGFCNAHYIRYRNGLDMNSPIKHRAREAICKITNCEENYSIIRRRTIKKILINWFNNKCIKCNKSYSLPEYDFHHIENKDHSISELLNNGNPETIAKEIMKCKLLCSNCHRKEHYKEIEYE